MSSTTKHIARQRVNVLFLQASRIYKTNPQLAQSYMVTARKLAMAARIRLTTSHKRRVCKDCNMLLIPGVSSRVRIRPRRERHLVVTCLKCSGQTRIPLRGQKKGETKE